MKEFGSLAQGAMQNATKQPTPKK